MFFSVVQTKMGDVISNVLITLINKSQLLLVYTRIHYRKSE